MLEKLLEKIKSSLRIWMHINFLKVNGGVDPCAALRARVARLEDAGKNILSKIPKTKNDYSGVGYCFGCGVVKWASGQGNYSEECKPDCVLQAFRRALGEK